MKKEFQVIMTKGKLSWYINFPIGTESISNILLMLSNDEMKNFLKFLVISQDKERLPQGIVAYGGFDITKDQPIRLKSEDLLKYSKNERENIKRSLVPQEINLQKANVCVVIKRDTFLRFRKYCLDLAKNK